MTPRNVRLNTVEPTRMKITNEVSFAVVFIACLAATSQAAVDQRQDQRAGRTHRAAFGRRRDAEEDRAEHQEDQRERRESARTRPGGQQLEAAQRARFGRQRRRGLGPDDRRRCRT